MATSAERQEAYRRRHLEDEEGGCRRLNMVINARAKKQLARLARYQGTTQKDCLERLLAEVERETVRSMSFGQVWAYRGGCVTKEDIDQVVGLEG